MNILNALALIFILFSVSCAAPLHNSFLKKEGVSKLNHFFSEGKEKALYTAEISIYGKSFSGLMFLKKIGEGNFRTVFMTPTGATLLDFSIINRSATLNFAIEEMNKSYIVNTLSKDMELLVITGTFNDYAEIFLNPETDETVFKIRDGENFIWYFADKESNVKRIEYTDEFDYKIIALFEKKSDSELCDIAITHQNINLSIRLKELPN